MTLTQQKHKLLEYLKQDADGYREDDIPANTLPVICNSGCIIDLVSYDQLDKMVDQATCLRDLELLCQKTLNFNWSVGFDEVCEYAGIDVGAYEFMGV